MFLALVRETLVLPCINSKLTECQQFCFALESSAAHMVITWGGTNSYLTNEERLALTPIELTHRTNASKAFLLGWNSYCGTVWTLKLCMIFFFRRVT